MFRLLIAMFLLSSATVVHGEEQDQCPPDELIYPCICVTDFTGYTYMRCERTRDMQQLQKVLNATKGWQLSLGFEKVIFGSIPSDFFSGIISYDINFENCKVDSFGTRPFSGMEESLEKIYIYGSVDKRRKDLETFPLGHLQKLHTLSFQANDIKTVGNDWFSQGPESLLEVSLEANDIEFLGDKAFSSLVNLKQLWLGDNRIPTVTRSMFPNPANHLTILEMSFNRLETLPDDFFTGMPNLHTLNLSGNKFTTLPESVFGKIWDSLTEVYVERMPLLCDKRLRWIYENRKLPEIFIGRCSSGNKLSGKELKELKAEDFDF